MVTLITWEHENSQPEVREFETVAACYNLAKNGGFYNLELLTMSSKFYSHTDTVDFEGIQLPLPNIYRYITRDERGFIEALRSKPVRDLEFGGFRSLDGDLPICFGHQSGENLPVVARQYRRHKITRALISLTGSVVE